MITNNKMRVVKKKWMRWNRDNLGCPTTTAQDILNHYLNLGNLDKQVFPDCNGVTMLIYSRCKMGLLYFQKIIWVKLNAIILKLFTIYEIAHKINNELH